MPRLVAGATDVTVATFEGLIIHIRISGYGPMILIVDRIRNDVGGFTTHHPVFVSANAAI